MNLLLIGASSFIGQEIYRQAKMRNFNVVGTATQPHNRDWYSFDLKNDTLDDLLRKADLSSKTEELVAIITAFYCGNERTVVNLKEAEQVNLWGSQRLLDALQEKNIRTLWFSTEQVFSGRDGCAPYKETDTTSPVFAYGRHKAEMECYIRENMPETIIYRLSQNIAPYVEGIHIFNDVYLRYLKGERHFKSIQGQIISPTDVRDTAKWAIEGILRKLPGGIYHFANPESMPRVELVRRFLSALGNEADVEEAPLETFNFKESRPMDNRMCIDKIMDAMPEIEFTSTDDVIKEFVKNI